MEWKKVYLVIEKKIQVGQSQLYFFRRDEVYFTHQKDRLLGEYVPSVLLLHVGFVLLYARLVERIDLLQVAAHSTGFHHEIIKVTKGRHRGIWYLQ